MKKQNLYKIIFFAGIVATLCSCNQSKAYKSEMIPTEYKSSKSRVSNITYDNAEVAAYNDSYSFSNYEEADIVNNGAVFDRKLIKTGNLTIEVDSFKDAEQKIAAFVNSFGGYITDSYIDEYSFHSTIKIPANKFEQAMKTAGSIGKVKNNSINSQDVTDEFYDLESRLLTKKIMQSNLEKYLSEAKDIKDLLEIEKQLNTVISDIEVMEGRLKRLSNQIDFSTIYIYLQLPVGHVETGFEWPDLGEAFKKFGANFVNFMAGLIMIIFYIVVFGIPIIALLALLFWLLFGRIGLLRKLFKCISKKKTKD